MSIKRLLVAVALTLSPAAVIASPSAAMADVYVYRLRPVVVPPVPPLRPYVAPAPVVTVAPHCVNRTVQVWAAGAYTYRTVRTCY